MGRRFRDGLRETRTMQGPATAMDRYYEEQCSSGRRAITLLSVALATLQVPEGRDQVHLAYPDSPSSASGLLSRR